MLANAKVQPLTPSYHIPELEQRYRDYNARLCSPRSVVDTYEEAKKELKASVVVAPFMFASGFFFGIALMLFWHA